MSEDTPDFLMEAPALLQSGDINGALAMVEKAIVANHEDHQAWRMKSLIHTALGQADHAAEAMARSEELDSGGVDSQLARAAELALAGGHEAALEVYAELIAEDASLFEALAARAHLLLEIGRKEEAITDAQKAIEIEPSEPQLHYLLGTCLRKCGRNAEAITAFNQAISLDETTVLAHYEKGMTFEQQDMLPESLACFERVQELSPADQNAQQAIQAIKQRIGQKDGGGGGGSTFTA